MAHKFKIGDRVRQIYFPKRLLGKIILTDEAINGELTYLVEIESYDGRPQIWKYEFQLESEDAPVFVVGQRVIVRGYDAAHPVFGRLEKYDGLIGVVTDLEGTRARVATSTGKTLYFQVEYLRPYLKGNSGIDIDKAASSIWGRIYRSYEGKR